jgi:hypothetical protein
MDEDVFIRPAARDIAALARLCLMGLAIVTITALAPHVKESYGFDALIPLIIASGLITIAATRVAVRVDPKWGLVLVLAFALAVRVILLPEKPLLSSDIYRYVWDGRVQGAGINPYRYVPADAALSALRDEAIYSHINRAEYAHTIYPPVAQMFFFAVTRVSDTVTAMRLALVGCEAVIIAVVIDLLRRFGLPAATVVAYAWHPLAFWEVANNGHVEGLMVALMMLAVWIAVSARPFAAGVMLAFAVLVKPYAIIASPALWRRWDWRLPFAFVLTGALCYLPYLGVGKSVLGFLTTGYLAEEHIAEGNGFWPVLAIRRTFGAVPGLLSAYIAIAGAVMGALALRAGLRADRSPPAVLGDAVVLLMAGLFFLSPNYPWYFLAIVPFLPLVGSAPAWVLTIGAFVLYPLWPDDDFDAHYLIWKGVFSVGFLAAVAWDFTARSRNRRRDAPGRRSHGDGIAPAVIEAPRRES